MWPSSDVGRHAERGRSPSASVHGSPARARSRARARARCVKASVRWGRSPGLATAPTHLRGFANDRRRNRAHIDRRRSAAWATCPGGLPSAIPGAAVVAALLWVGDAAWAALVALVAAFAAFEGVRLLARRRRPLALATGALSGRHRRRRGDRGAGRARAGAGLAAFALLATRRGLRGAPGRADAVRSWPGRSASSGSAPRWRTAVLLRELEHGGVAGPGRCWSARSWVTRSPTSWAPLFGRDAARAVDLAEQDRRGVRARGSSAARPRWSSCAAIVDEPWFELGEAALIGLGVTIAAPSAVTCSSPRSSARRASRIRARFSAHTAVCSTESMRSCSLCRSATTWQWLLYELAASLARAPKALRHPLGAQHGDEADEEAGDVVDDVVPAEVDGRDDGEAEHRPQAVADGAMRRGRGARSAPRRTSTPV